MDNRRVYSESQVPSLRFLPSSFFSNQENLLSPRQLHELNASVLQYLKPILNSNPETYETIKTKLEELQNKNNDNKYSSLLVTEIPENYLQKRWSTVLRLQRNIQELETKYRDLQDKNDELMKTLDNLNKSITTSNNNNNSNSTNITLLSSISKLDWIPSIPKVTLRYHNSSITAIAIHPFNPYLITASEDGMLVFWNMLDFAEPLNHIKNAHFKSINKLIFKPNSSILISCSSDQIIKLWDLSTNIENIKTPLKIFTGHEHIISSLSISIKNPNMLFSCSRDKSIKIWDLETGWTLHTINAHSDWVRSIDSIDDYIISCSSDTSIRLTHWPTQTGIGICLGHKQVIEDIKLFPTSSNKYLDKLIEFNDKEDLKYKELGYKYAVSCGRDKLIKIWKLPLPEFNIVNGNPIANTMNPYGECIKEIKGHKSWVRNLQIHYNGKYLLSCSDDQAIKIWDLENLINNNNNNNTIEPIKILTGHQSFVNTITMATRPSDDLNDDNIRCYLISGGADNLINVWV